MPKPATRFFQQLDRTAPLAIATICIGVVLGILVYTFVYAKGYSYLTNDPAACANCHVMREQYDGWAKSTHHAVATCNDCHTPSSLVGKYYTKALNGFWHSFYFTTGTFHEPIQANARNKKIANESCLKCHSDLVHDTVRAGARHHRAEPQSCVRCHGVVGHSRQ